MGGGYQKHGLLDTTGPICYIPSYNQPTQQCIQAHYSPNYQQITPLLCCQKHASLNAHPQHVRHTAHLASWSHSASAVHHRHLQQIQKLGLICRGRYGLDVPGIVPRWGRDFMHPSRPVLGPTQPPI
jgi:hypothetical protein